MERVTYHQPPLGCDPEFFFTNAAGKLVGAESVLPAGGLKVGTKESKMTIDGVCVELNPTPMGCRANLGNEIKKCFKDFKLNALKGDISTSFDSLVTLSKAELDVLSDDSKLFGCDESQNAYTKKASKIDVGDPMTYPNRSAGGHIHIGRHQDMPKVNWALAHPEITIPLTDLILGIPAVLMDHGEASTKRREIYGRAGEYRTPEHGLEYRVLSNFWLRAYPLMSFVMGMARMAVNITGHDEGKLAGKFLKEFPRALIEDTINTNNVERAFKIFYRIEPMLWDVVGNDRNDNWPTTQKTTESFHYFITKPLDFWFPDDPVDHWIDLNEGHRCGWENFCKTVVPERRTKEEEEAKN